MRNIRLELCYDGTRYRGWQRQRGQENTIQGKLETALSRILDEEVELYGSGRTDAGVHAAHQVANFHCANPMPCEQILFLLRKHLPEDIGIQSCKQVCERFHARLNAKSKTYCYRIWNSDAPCVFQRRYVTVWPEKLDVEKMRRAAAYLTGEHDFAAFCTHASAKKSTVRRIDAIEVSTDGCEISISVTGNGFLHNMVRILVGTLVEVGQAERTERSVAALFGAQRAQAGRLMPAQGLCLMEVTY